MGIGPHAHIGQCPKAADRAPVSPERSVMKRRWIGRALARETARQALKEFPIKDVTTMYPVRYIHAADLHLDAAFRGLSREATSAGADVARTLHRATFTALERLFRLCETENPDFLVIAGDIYNQEDRSLKAQFALRDGCERLAARGIRVFLAHGNHDPLSSRLRTLSWPENVTVFGGQVETHPVLRDGAPVALVHGISHAAARESRNLAKAFHRARPEAFDSGKDGQDCFQLGVLHCTVENVRHPERYAPCTLDDLRAAELDAWALGHVHERRILCEAPFIAYPGNIQGLHVNDPGPRGCLLITATPEAGQGFACNAVFHDLAPVRWETLEISVEGLSRPDAVETSVQDAMEAAAARTDVGCEALMVRVRLTGRTPLDSELRAPDALADLAERLRDAASGTPLVWLKDIDIATGQMLNMDELRRREDLLGETLRGIDEVRRSPDALRELLAGPLNPLFRHPKARKALQPPADAELAALLDDAERLCIDLMEAH